MNEKRKVRKESISRKEFIKRSSLSLLGIGVAPLGFSILRKNKQSANNTNPGNHFPEDDSIRSITYNVFNGCLGYKGINGRNLPPGEYSKLIKAARKAGQIPKRIMMELALYKPNIINFSEGPDQETVAQMAKMLDMNFAFFPGAENGKGGFPGCILTSFEIVSYENRPFVNEKPKNSADLFTRHWGKAIIKLPNRDLIAVHSAHLWPFKKGAKDTEIRLAEIDELLKSIDHDLQHDVESVLLQGDLNQVPESPEYRKYIQAGMYDTVEMAKEKNNLNTISSIDPTRRIDFILTKGKIQHRITDHRVLFEGNFRTNMADPYAYALSDHLPVMIEFGVE